MVIQSAVACSEAKDDGLLVSRQLMERVLVWVVSFSLAVEDGFFYFIFFIMDKSFIDMNNITVPGRIDMNNMSTVPGRIDMNNMSTVPGRIDMKNMSTVPGRIDMNNMSTVP